MTTPDLNNTRTPSRKLSVITPAEEITQQPTLGEQYLIIPPTIWNNPDLSATEMVVLSWVFNLTAQRGYCWASNETLARLTKRSESTVKRAIIRGLDLNIIRTESITRKNFTNASPERRIYFRPAHEAEGQDEPLLGGQRFKSAQAEVQDEPHNNKDILYISTSDRADYLSDDFEVLLDLDKQDISTGKYEVVGVPELLFTPKELKDAQRAYTTAGVQIGRGIAFVVAQIQADKERGKTWTRTKTYMHLVGFVLEQLLDTKTRHWNAKAAVERAQNARGNRPAQGRPNITTSKPLLAAGEKPETLSRDQVRNLVKEGLGV